MRWDVSPTAIPDLTPEAMDTVVQRLLTLLSPAVRLEPGLLRVERLPAHYDVQVREAVHDLYESVRAYLDDAWAPAWFDPAVLSPAGQTVHQVMLW